MRCLNPFQEVNFVISATISKSGMMKTGSARFAGIHFVKGFVNSSDGYMMTEELTDCLKCGYERALTHWSSDGSVNWIACPKCRTFFDHNVETKPESNYADEINFWHNVDEDTAGANDFHKNIETKEY